MSQSSVGFFDVELSEDQFSCLSYLLWVHSEADLLGMLSLEAHAVLFELFESLALTFTHMICPSLTKELTQNERLKAELNSDGHEVRILCYLRILVGPISSVPLHISRLLFIDFD